MSENHMDNQIKKAFDSIAPDLLPSLLAELPQQKGVVIDMTKERNKKFGFTRILAVVAAFVLLVGGVFGAATLWSDSRVASSVSLEVNPSIRIDVTRKEKVVDVIALNDDARVVIGDMDFKGSQLDVAIYALIGSMLKNGYLSDIANSVLVSVDTDDDESGKALQAKLSKKIAEMIHTDSFDGAVISQVVVHDDEVDAMAEDNDISVGKAQLIRQLVKQNERYKVEELAKLSINELNLLSSKPKKESASEKPIEETVQTNGVASEKLYIGAEKAKQAALKHANVNESVAMRMTCELDYDDGRMVYEVDFLCEGVEYDYEIDAKSGNVLKSEKEVDRDDVDTEKEEDRPTKTRVTTSVTSSASGKTSATSVTTTVKPTATAKLIGKDAAKAAALTAVGVKEDEIRDYEWELDHDDGMTVYEIEFKVGNAEYSVEVNAKTGAILKNHKEIDD